MIRSYKEFKQEILLESLIIESKLEISDKLKDILKSMKYNKIANDIINLYNTKKDIDIRQNYIDTGTNKDEVTFISNTKAEEILGKEPLKYQVVRSNYYLTHNNRNNDIFNRLGYTKPEGDPWEPSVGTFGEIKAEAKSNVSENIYVWFVSDSGEQTVINKKALVLVNPSANKVWSTNRNPIKIGRLIRALLNASNIKFTDKEVEDFVNGYKSVIDIMNDAFLKFKVVTGSEIPYWYSSKRYESEQSTLGNSCMANVSDDFFDLYCYNKNCSLLILFSDKYSLVKDGKYTSSKIRGRALVWNTDQGDTFVDRIYTNNDSDVSLFINYAHSNGWWTKTSQNSSTQFSVSNGTSNKKAEYTVSLESSRFDNYPYVDSLSYINFDKKKISNVPILVNPNGFMNGTDGCYDELD